MNPADILNPKQPQQMHDDEIESIGDGNWLEGNVLNYSIDLLRNAHPDVGGMYNTHWMVSGFPPVTEKKLLQPLNITNVHWILASKGFLKPHSHVYIFDSNDMLKNSALKEKTVLNSIAQLMKTSDEFIRIRTVGCQQQNDGHNCGFSLLPSWRSY